MPDFHVVIQRYGSRKFGFKVAVADDVLFIHSIHGSQIEDMNMRCRSCCVEQILEQQLLEKDRVVCVNGKTGSVEMLANLSDVSLPCCHLRVRRNFQQPAALVGVARADLSASGVSTESPTITPPYKISSISVVVPERSWCPRARVIETYDPVREPERGYLTVVEGTVVAVQAGSRAPSEALNQFACHYVYVWNLDGTQTGGWVPEYILDISGQ